MQKDQNGKEYEGIRVTETFEYENARSAFVAITEKNKKQYVRPEFFFFFLDKMLNLRFGNFRPIL